MTDTDDLEPLCYAWVMLASALVAAGLIFLCVGVFLWGWR